MPITVEGMEPLLRKLNPRILKPAAIAMFEKAGEIAVPEIQKQAPIFKGGLRKRARLRIQKASGDEAPTLARIGSTAPHAHLLDLGTSPHWPDTRKDTKGGRRFRLWVRRNLSLQPGANRQESEDKTVFVVARAMSVHGTRGRFFMREAFRATQGQIHAILEAFKAEMQREWERVK